MPIITRQDARSTAARRAQANQGAGRRMAQELYGAILLPFGRREGWRSQIGSSLIDGSAARPALSAASAQRHGCPHGAKDGAAT